MTPPLSPDAESRLVEFLAPSRMAVVATVSSDGMPQLTPNWYVYESGRISVSTTKERVKYRNVSRDQRMAVCIYSEPRAAEYVTVRGPAEIADGEAIWPTTLSIVKRYVAPEDVDERMRELRTQNRVIISIKPERVVFRT